MSPSTWYLQLNMLRKSPQELIIETTFMFLSHKIIRTNIAKLSIYFRSTQAPYGTYEWPSHLYQCTDLQRFKLEYKFIEKFYCCYYPCRSILKDMPLTWCWPKPCMIIINNCTERNWWWHEPKTTASYKLTGKTINDFAWTRFIMCHQ